MKEVTVCDFQHRNNEPCYGEIQSYLDGDNKYWITVCEGHQAVPHGGAYISKDPIRRWIFSEQNKKIRQLENENELLRALMSHSKMKLMELQYPNDIEIPPERLEILYA